MPEEEKNDIWVISNRKDDRVVLWERDPAHPSGEAFIGGPAPAFVHRTGSIEQLLLAGLIVEIPEPPGEIDGKPNPKKPTAVPRVDEIRRPDGPGEPIRLGREFDPMIVPEEAQAKVQEDLDRRRVPEAIPVPSGVIIPPPIPPENTTSRE